MQSGLINKVAVVTPASIPDAQGFKYVCPNGGAVYADKDYCTKPAKTIAAIKSVHLCAPKKKNMKGKNYDLDRYYTKLRAPFERVFSHSPKRTRYIGLVKNQFAAIFEAICFNLKRICRLQSA